MSIEAEIQTAEAEALVRFLAKDANYGKKFTPYSISTALHSLKIGFRKTEKLLSMLALKFPEVFGYERLSASMYFSVSASSTQFRTWFQAWFRKAF